MNCSDLAKQRIALGSLAVGFVGISIWNWVYVANGSAQGALVDRVTECVCSVALDYSPKCQTALSALIPPGLGIANVTDFCTNPQSLLATTKVTASWNVATGSIGGVSTLIAGVALAGKVIYDWCSTRNQYTSV